jgi:hypothetical protein
LLREAVAAVAQDQQMQELVAAEQGAILLHHILQLLQERPTQSQLVQVGQAETHQMTTNHQFRDQILL